MLIKSTKPTLLAASLTLFGSSICVSTAHAAGTTAGTAIKNTATASYDLPGGATGTATSNEVSITVDELLDVIVASTDPSDVDVSAGDTNQILTFRLTNSGNGSEAFSLIARDTASGDQFDPTATSIVLDSNGNGSYDPGIDTVYVAGSNDPQLNADQSLTVFVLSTIPAGASAGQRGRVDLVASARTGTGTPGTSFAGLGQGGGDAVVGASGADAEDDGFYAVASGGSANVSFLKSATVVDPFGGTKRVPGSTITYSLVATASGSGSLSNLRIADTIPTGSTYKAGTITLDGTSLTDQTDGDAGEFASSVIAVRLGNLSAGSSKTVTFEVTIN